MAGTATGAPPPPRRRRRRSLCSRLAGLLLALWDVVAVYGFGVFELIRQQLRGYKAAQGLCAEDSDVAVVTGGAEGIGFQVSLRLALLGMTVVIAGPDQEAGRVAIAKIKAEKDTARVIYLELDLSSLLSVRVFVKDFVALGKPLHLLVNNAGVMFTPMDASKQVDAQLAVNYLGHFLLTRLLLPHLAASGSPKRNARVVNVSSVMHNFGDVRRVVDNEPRSSHSCYCDSKLAVVMATYYLERQLRSKALRVSATCVHPGIVASSLYRNVWLPLRLVQATVLAPLLFMTTEQGASSVLYAAASAHTEGAGGIYLDNCTPARTCRQSYDADLQRSLWVSSSRLVGLGEEIVCHS